MNQKLSWLLLSPLLGGAVLTGCSEENPKPTNGEGDQNPTSKTPTELYYANMFGKEAMSTYYYWNKEMSSNGNETDTNKNFVYPLLFYIYESKRVKSFFLLKKIQWKRYVGESEKIR